MAGNKENTGNSFMNKLATFIVDKRNLFFLLTIIMLIFSAFSRNWVEVESELSAYLPNDSETRQALDVMEEQFATFGSAQVMVANISQEQAEELKDQIAGIKGVQGVEYDNTEDHYNNDSALYAVTFDYDESDVAFPLSQKCPYAYGESSLKTPVLNETQIAENMIHDN